MGTSLFFVRKGVVWIGVIGFMSVIGVGVMFCKTCKALLHNVLCL